MITTKKSLEDITKEISNCTKELNTLIKECIMHEDAPIVVFNEKDVSYWRRYTLSVRGSLPDYEMNDFISIDVGSRLS